MQIFEQVDNIHGTCTKRRVIEVICCTMVWYLWRFQNDNVFGGGKIRKDTIFYSIREVSFIWITNRFRNMFFFGIVGFISLKQFVMFFVLFSSSLLESFPSLYMVGCLKKNDEQKSKHL